MKKHSIRKRSILFSFFLLFFALPSFNLQNPLPTYSVKAEEHYIEPNYPKDFSPNASTLQPQWNHNVMNIGEAWEDGYTGAGIKIAILDTGFYHRHPDISMSAGYSVFPDDAWSNDHSGHGTHIAGIISAKQGTPYQGIAPDAEVYGIKIYHNDDVNENGDVSTDVNSVVKGIEHAITIESDIIVISSGLSYHDENLYNVIKEAHDQDILIIAASGNGNLTVNYPASYSEVIAVTAVDERLNPALDIIYGQENDFSAPGVNIGGLSIPDSTYSYPYIFMSGSSQATPHAAGLAAILMQKYDVRGEEIRKIMQDQALNIGDSGLFGHGLLYYQSDEKTEIVNELPEEENDVPDVATNDSETSNDEQEETEVRKPASSREADPETDSDEAEILEERQEATVTRDDTGMGELTGNILSFIEPGGSLELSMKEATSLRLTERQVYEIRQNNISVILTKEHVSWKIPPANFVPGEANLRFYEGRPIGVRQKENPHSSVYTISIFQYDSRREVYPSWMEVRFDLSGMDVEKPHNLDAYFFHRETSEWVPSDSKVDGETVSLRTRHTSAVGFFDPAQFLDIADVGEDSEEDTVPPLYSNLFTGALIFILLLAGVRLLLGKNKR